MTITGRKASILVGALIVSVCLNVFAAAGWATHEFKDRGRRSGGYGIARLIQSAPEPARGIVEAEFQAAKPAILERVRSVREARADIARLVRDPDADDAALQAAFSELRRRGGEVEILVHETLLKTLGRMPQDARSQWAGAWENRR